MVIFLDMWPQKVLERSVIYQVYLKQLQTICKFTASPCQILCRDGVYICKSCYNKVKKNKVPCRAVAYKSLGELSPEELLPSQTRIKAIRLEIFLAARKTLFQSQSHDQRLYFHKPNLKRNVDCNFCSKVQKILQYLKLYAKLIGSELSIIIIPLEKPKIEVHIFDRATIPGHVLREFRTV